MKVYTNCSFKGHWPVGTSAVIVAENKKQAQKLLTKALIKAKLGKQRLSLKNFMELDLQTAHVEVLQDGDY